ncbi:class I SAM-dependent methyltransferase [Paenibacillus sp. GCM10027626]|uniref:class I SAM-dependent methyltransferase n=1 Tax=Paenibacillus sp. GCM10027626 TaxID=3273411 RepID=UPI00363CF353
MGFLSVLGMAQKLVAERLSPGDIAIDATCGNGVDTRFLAELLGTRGTLYGFDIQEQALSRTRERLMPLASAGTMPQLHLLLESHADMRSHIAASDRGHVAAVMFNLGYLPGADPGIITMPDGTIAALNAALSLLRAKGILTIVLYPGHDGGEEEAAAVEQWAAALPQSEGQAILYRLVQKPQAPYLIAVEKK